MRYCLALAAAAILIAGCGGSSDASPAAAGGDKPTIRNAATVTEAQVKEALDLRTVAQPEVSLSVDVTPGGCAVDDIHTRKQDIDFYTSAGTQLVTNPAGTVAVEPGAGVQTVDGSEPRIEGVLVKRGDEPGCLAEIERGLAKLK